MVPSPIDIVSIDRNEKILHAILVPIRDHMMVRIEGVPENLSQKEAEKISSVILAYGMGGTS